jgi:hypothetical protein
MLTQYRLARGAGHSIFASLKFAIFDRPLGPASDKELMRKFLARVADIERRSRERFRN